MRRKTMEPLDRVRCMELIRKHPAGVGRVALAGPRPVIFPVNYALDGDNVVFRTDPGSKFHAAVARAFVAFEVDWVEPTWRAGWSVVVRGQAHVVTDAGELERLAELPLVPWVVGDKDRFVSIEPQLVSGRRLLDGAPG